MAWNWQEPSAGIGTRTCPGKIHKSSSDIFGKKYVNNVPSTFNTIINSVFDNWTLSVRQKHSFVIFLVIMETGSDVIHYHSSIVCHILNDTSGF